MYRNLTGDGTFTFTYDTENRLLTAAKTGMSASYAYDPNGPAPVENGERNDHAVRR